jgi:ribose transport system substrate-binding protein
MRGRGWAKMATRCVMAVLVATALSGAGSAVAKTKDGKFLVYYSMSYIGNAWQAEAKNAIVAMSKTAAYHDKVELRVQASGANAQRQIEQMNAMIQAGADAIVAFPISPTALNGVIRSACQKNVVVVVVNGVTEPCAHIVKIDGEKHGARLAKWIFDSIGGKGNIVYITGVPGVSYSEDYGKGVMDTAKNYPGVHITGTLVGMWDQSTARVVMREFLATHSWDDIDGIVAGTGCYTIDLMQIEDKRWPGKPLIPCAGESSNGGRLQMFSPESGIEGAASRNGISIGSGLFAVPYAFKIAMRVLDGEKIDRITYYEGLAVTKDNLKLCKTGTAADFAAGCNVIPPGIVPPDYAIDFWSPQTPELGVNAALLGEPDY